MRYLTANSSFILIRILTDTKGRADGREASLAYEYLVTVVAISTARSLEPVEQPQVRLTRMSIYE